MIPTLDMARIFASTPQNVAFFSETIERSKLSGFEMGVLVLKFPFLQARLFSINGEPLINPDLPDEIKLAGTQIPNFIKQETKFRTFWEWE